MPQLPSGRHIVLDAAPIVEILDRKVPAEIDALLTQISGTDDMHRFIRILDLVPGAGPQRTLAQGSLPLPDGHVVRDTGLRLSDWPQGCADWPAADREFFADFLQTRAADFVRACLADVEQRRRAWGSEAIRLLGDSMLRAGCHPSQDPQSGWEDLPETPDLDVHDALAALAQCHAALVAAVGEARPYTHATERLQGIWMMVRAHLVDLPDDIDLGMPPLVLGEQLRRIDVLRAEPERIDWWLTQVPIECRNLDNDPACDAFFKHAAPRAWGVVRAISIARTDAWTARRGSHPVD
jgi:hypothetical protein